MRYFTHPQSGQEIDLDAQPTQLEKLIALAARNQEWHPSYAAEKVAQTLQSESFNELISGLDTINRERFFALRSAFLEDSRFIKELSE